MTERLYYTDVTVLEFDGRIVGVRQDSDGRFGTVLDRSAFYPTSGGQNCDRGTLAEVDLVAVIEDKNGEVVHVTETSVGQPGETVHGQVDPAVRRRHRQQHTAQHILSQAFTRLVDQPTVSVHLGEEYGAIELGTSTLAEADLDAVEALANETIDAHLPVEILLVDSEEARQLPLRRVPPAKEKLRIIRIGDFDWSACGGTHCLNTAEVGLVKIIGTEQIRKHLLVKFLSGHQALADYRQRFAVTSEVSRHLTCHVSDLPERVYNLTDEQRSLRTEIAALQRELLPIRAEALAAEAQTVGETRAVAAAIEGLEPSVAMPLAAAVAERVSGAALLAVGTRLVLAVGRNAGLHAGDLIRKLAASTGLKGGGGPATAQAGGADPEKIDAYRTRLMELLDSE